MAAILDTLRGGAWVTRERARLVGFALLAASVLGLAFILATANGLNDRLGQPLGTDFSNIYAAGTYVLEGEASKPFDPAAQWARERVIFGAATPLYGWHYPPFFLGLAALLASMPYLVALLVWQGVTLILYLLAIRSILSSPSPLQGEAKQDRLWLPLALAYPAVFINIGHGHNGFLTAALFTAALLTLDKRPVLSGVLIGCLAYKPQFGLLIPLVLIATGRWRVFIAAAITVAAMAVAVTLAFGVDVWRAFIASGEFTRTVVLEQGSTGWHKIQTLFSWARMWGASIPVAYAVQAIATLGVAVGIVALWRSRAPFALKAAALLIGSLLATPYSLDYDMMLIAPAIAFLAADAFQRGAPPWQKTLLAALWLTPLIARSVAQATHIPIGAPVMLLSFTWLLHYAMHTNDRIKAARFAGEAP
ncbi:MAG: glycosyltransferase family 87 protein [Pseudolabrys sp.]|jgi:hypothetical protein